jgi:YD repeat-containing protein
LRYWLGVSRYAYDANDRLVEVTDGLGQTIRYEWTLTGQRSSIVYQDGESAEYLYDLLNIMVEVCDDNGKTITFEYDERLQ